MKLIFYSGGGHEENEELDNELLDMIETKNPVFTLIPSSFEEADHYYSEFIEHFSVYGVKKFRLFPIDVPFRQDELNEALHSDMIFLSGGNTFYFLQRLKKMGLLARLKSYASEGGVLAGLSAGSIIMTPNIKTASYPYFDRDENEVGLKNLKALDLVDFEFFPHYANTRRYIHVLNEQSRFNSSVIWACCDGSGIVINTSSRKFVGDIWGFFRGKKMILSKRSH